jgi:hypothetical protein
MRRGESMPNLDGGKTVQQAVNMAPLGWMPLDRGTGGQRSNQTGVPGEGGNGDRNCNPPDDPAIWSQEDDRVVWRAVNNTNEMGVPWLYLPSMTCLSMPDQT